MLKILITKACINRKNPKGKGYKPAEDSGDKYHGVSKFNVSTGEQSKSKSNNPSYTQVFIETLNKACGTRH